MANYFLSTALVLLLASPGAAYSQIIWNNVPGTIPLQDPSQLMRNSQQNMDRAFDSLQNLLRRSEDTNRSNWEQMKRNNTDQFIYIVNSYGSAKALSDDRTQLLEMLKGFGAQVDVPAAFNAYDTRMMILMRQ